jgi:hypothetical protein
VAYRAVLEAKLKRVRKRERREEIEAELNPPLPPACVRYLFTIYGRLRRRKGSGGFGPQAIEFCDIEAFQRLTAANLSPWEITVLEDLDDLFLFEKSKPPEPGRDKPQDTGKGK